MHDFCQKDLDTAFYYTLLLSLDRSSDLKFENDSGRVEEPISGRLSLNGLLDGADVWSKRSQSRGGSRAKSRELELDGFSINKNK